ncbi:4-nitrophenyl phosphatase [Cryptococcus gattii EJB2]|uniref:4-nitrophenylphosphatase n=1 Tax=Cryptococcus gattii EJB2 TaxID=1296103 RepID=A0ABR5BWG5_9TREE|nr:4-nitrophenyl phosphatase [Cryptococcus gattii EJB2]
MAPPFLKSQEEYEELVDSVDTFLLDCDGVLYHGKQIVEGVRTVLDMLRKKGKKIIFVTNNATKSRRKLKETFDHLGLNASLDECFGSAYASAVYISQVLNFPKDKKVYVFGEEGLEEELDQCGIAHCGGSDPVDREFKAPIDFTVFKPDDSIGAVLCGFDSWINYQKLAKAMTYLRNPECKLILTNTDPTFPTHGDVFPGSGSLSIPIVNASKRKPLVIGKPNKMMMDAILAHHKFDSSRALMVGDNLATDIAFGRNSKIRTLLVMGGVTKYEQVFGENPNEVVPDLVMNSFGDLAVLADASEQ